MSMMVYLLKVNLALMIAWALYRLAFRNLTFFQWNRLFLAGSVVLSLLLPLLKLQIAHSAGVAVVASGIDWTYVDHLAALPAGVLPESRMYPPGWIFALVYGCVTLFFLTRNIRRIHLLYNSVRPSRRVRNGSVKVYVHDLNMGSFTLFRRIYLDRYAYENNLRHVLRHETVHASQLHTLDVLFMEFVVAFLWFNPFVYVLLRYVRDNHEYLADQDATGTGNSLVEYLECLKAETLRYHGPVPASCFFCSTIKKRIIMLTNHRSNNNVKWRYLGIIPVIALMLVLFHTPAEQLVAVSAESLFVEGGAPSLFPLPVKYKEKITWAFDQNAIHPISKKEVTHKGIDIAAPSGTAVFASAEGVVLKALSEEGWGKLIVLEHSDGFTTAYAHLDEIGVSTGDKVSRGGVIGKVGNTGQSTGPHLHYEVRLNGKEVNPADYY